MSGYIEIGPLIGVIGNLLDVAVGGWSMLGLEVWTLASGLQGAKVHF